MSVKIYKPAKNAMQSGKGNTKKWVLEHDNEDSRYIEPVMGWTGNSNPKSQINLKFDSKEAAIEYAKRKGIKYEVCEPNESKLKLQSYSDTLM